MSAPGAGSAAGATGATGAAHAAGAAGLAGAAGVADEVLLARAYLSRVAEPANIPLWGLVREVGAVEAAAIVRAGGCGHAGVSGATAARKDVDPRVDLDAAERHGIRLVVPESSEWPHYAMAAIENAGAERLARYRRPIESNDKLHSDQGEPVPPLALWVRGPGDLSSLAVRSVGIVGARAATEYGELLARRFARGLAEAQFTVVSGGAFGIDVAAHRGALDVGGQTVLVSAGGVDNPYPSAHGRLFDIVAQTGLLVSESPPGCAPRRRRFLTRNRIVASLSTGCVVVEAGLRSGALNTLGHCGRLDRPVMAVPGPVTSAMSAGCHYALTTDRWTGRLVASVDDVLAEIGGASDLPAEPVRTRTADVRTSRLDALDSACRAVFDGFPSGRAVSTDELIALSGLGVAAVLGALPQLELAGLIERGGGGFRMT